MFLLLLLIVAVRGTMFRPLGNINLRSLKKTSLKQLLSLEVQANGDTQHFGADSMFGAPWRREGVAEYSEFIGETKLKSLHKGSEKLRYEDKCDSVCTDLPKNDKEAVCMMFSRYKKGYQFFMNMCHARRAICKENLLLHMVHPSRCKKTNQYFMPVN